MIYYAEDEGLKDIVVLNPEWLTKAISYVLEGDLTRQAGGILDHERLKDIWHNRQDGYAPRYRPYFLRLMEKADVSYRLDGDETRTPAWLPGMVRCPAASTARGLCRRLCGWCWSAGQAASSRRVMMRHSDITGTLPLSHSPTST